MTRPHFGRFLSDLDWPHNIDRGILTTKKSETNARPSREKKMRKKRKTKKKVQDEGVSETDSSEDGMNQNIKPSPQKRKSLSKEEKPSGSIPNGSIQA